MIQPLRVTRWKRSIARPACVLALAAAAVACSSKDDPVGGPSGYGGSAPGSGGQNSSGQGTSGGQTAAGQSNLGGALASGGVAAGGVSPMGGASGGSNPSGGVPATGGASNAGTNSAGGAVSAGGASGGAAGSNSGGTSSSGAQAGTGPGGSGSSNPPVIAAGVRWVGRADVSDAAAPKFAWSGSGFVATVTGATISVKLKSEGGSEPIFFQPVIDGSAKMRFSVATADGTKTVTLGTGLTEGDHVVELYRETEGKANYAISSFLGFASGTPKDPPAYNGRLIEVVGDSISAGYGNLGSEQHPNAGADPSGGCTFSTQTESAYMTYGAVAARALKADASILAASGWGIYSDNGGSTSNVLPKVWANTVGGQAAPAWSFAQKPQAVVINLGTNDFTASMSLSKDSFVGAYKAFLSSVRGKYPNAWIYCAIGPMLYGDGLKNATAYIKALVQDVNTQGDTKVKVLDFGQQDATKGTGCDWHPNVTENQRMADVLTRELTATLSW